MDASHFVWGAFAGYLWSLARLVLKAPSGRRRFNVLGAVDAVTKKVWTVANDSYITATTVCELLDKLAAEKLALSLTVVLDNARYQHCALVEGHARKLGIELLFLPSYSPNLNLIERFWRYVKKECLYNRYYATFADFKEAIAGCIAQAPVKDKARLDSLLSPRFQILNQETALAA